MIDKSKHVKVEAERDINDTRSRTRARIAAKTNIPVNKPQPPKKVFKIKEKKISVYIQIKCIGS